MEVLVDMAGYIVSIEPRKDELVRLERGETLEGEILLATDEEPFNAPTGKRLTLRVDPNAREVSDSYYPEDAGWEELEKIGLVISPEEYRRIDSGSGRVFGTKPRLSDDFMIQDMTAL